MKISLPWLAAILTVCGFMFWLPSTRPEPAADTLPAPLPAEPDWIALPAEGSSMPCQVPLPWRIARLDEEFGLDVPTVATVVSEAAALWETAVGRPLFVHDPQAGMPIRFVYDQRQARTDERRRLEAELERLRSTLDPAEFEARARSAFRVPALRIPPRRRSTARPWFETAPAGSPSAARSASTASPTGTIFDGSRRTNWGMPSGSDTCRTRGR